MASILASCTFCQNCLGSIYIAEIGFTNFSCLANPVITIYIINIIVTFLLYFVR